MGEEAVAGGRGRPTPPPRTTQEGRAAFRPTHHGAGAGNELALAENQAGFTPSSVLAHCSATRKATSAVTAARAASSGTRGRWTAQPRSGAGTRPGPRLHSAGQRPLGGRMQGRAAGRFSWGTQRALVSMRETRILPQLRSATLPLKPSFARQPRDTHVLCGAPASGSPSGSRCLRALPGGAFRGPLTHSITARHCDLTAQHRDRTPNQTPAENLAARRPSFSVFSFFFFFLLSQSMKPSGCLKG